MALSVFYPVIFSGESDYRLSNALSLSAFTS